MRGFWQCAEMRRGWRGTSHEEHMYLNVNNSVKATVASCVTHKIAVQNESHSARHRLHIMRRALLMLHIAVYLCLLV